MLAWALLVRYHMARRSGYESRQWHSSRDRNRNRADCGGRRILFAQRVELQNPVTDTPGNLRDARLHFADHCAICHANDGSCDTPFGRNLYPKPPDLRRQQTQKLTDGEIFWIIENGVRFTGMPAFGGAHGSEEDSWKLVRFIRHLPQLTAEERMEMEQNNPKSPGDREEEQEENEFLGGNPMQQKPEGEHHHH